MSDPLGHDIWVLTFAFGKVVSGAAEEMESKRKVHGKPLLGL